MEDFVTYEQAKALKELGFNWKCNHYYNTETKEFIENHNDYSPEDSFSDCSSYDNHNSCWNCISAPTLAQAQKWLSEVKGITMLVSIATNKETYITKKVFYFKWFNSEFILCGVSKCHYATYNEALSEAINKAIELLKTN